LTSPPTADQFLERLEALNSPAERERNVRGLQADADDRFVGVRMGQIFTLAREFMTMAPPEIERLLENPVHQVRVGAVSIMDWQARNSKTTPERRRELFDLYLRRHDRIDSWDLVDRSAIWVVGEYLRDKDRNVLDALARSDRPMERRTAILSTYAFIRRNDVGDTFRIAERLVSDDQELVQKAVGWMLREAGKRDPAQLASFLDAHADTMPRVMLRYAIEKLDPDQRARYLGRKHAKQGG
jgi:hypothetical protein